MIFLGSCGQLTVLVVLTQPILDRVLPTISEERGARSAACDNASLVTHSHQPPFSPRLSLSDITGMSIISGSSIDIRRPHCRATATPKLLKICSLLLDDTSALTVSRRTRDRDPDREHGGVQEQFALSSWTCHCSFVLTLHPARTVSPNESKTLTTSLWH